MLRSELKQLHTGLKDIEIYAHSIGMCFFDETDNTSTRPSDSLAGLDEESSNSDDDSRPAKRSKTHEVEQHDVPHTSMWNLGLTWPHLERLELANSNSKWCPPTGCFGSSALAMLPRTLKWFGFNYNLTRECAVDLSVLPSGLQTLRLSGESIGLIGLKTLPKSLTNLHYAADEDALAQLVKEPSILPNLKEFPFHWEDDECSQWRDVVWSEGYSWPTITTVMDQFEEDFSLLPPQITSIVVCVDGTSLELTPERLEHLPRHLTSLHMTAVGWEGLNVKYWPSTLTKLKFEKECGFGAHCFKLLPRSLRELLIESGNPDPQVPELARLCNDLESLRTIGKDSLLLEEEFWRTEKQRLLADGRQTYVDAIEAGGLFGLPLSLTKLVLPQICYPITQKLLMPPRLREFGLEYEHRVDDPNVFGAFDHISPVSLTINIIAPAEPIAPTASALYLCNLTSLTLAFEPNQSFDRPFQYLPRQLRHFTWKRYEFASITRTLADLDDLPPQLESLSFDFGLAEELWASHLPRTLKSLAISEAILLGQDFQNLPPHLESIDARRPTASVKQYRQLPRSIRRWAFYEEELKLLSCAYKPLWRMWETSEEGVARELECEDEPKGADVDVRAIRRLAQV